MELPQGNLVLVLNANVGFLQEAGRAGGAHDACQVGGCEGQAGASAGG